MVANEETHRRFGEEGHHHLWVDDPTHLVLIPKMVAAMQIVEGTRKVDTIIEAIPEEEKPLLLLLGWQKYGEAVGGIPLL